MFEGIKKEWREARGRLLETELDDSISKLKVANRQLYTEIYRHLLPIYGNVKARLFNMSSDGHIKAGKAFQFEAKKHYDLDVGKGYAHWIIGAWLESGQLPGEAAKRVHGFLDNFLNEMLKMYPDFDSSSQVSGNSFSEASDPTRIFDELGRVSHHILEAGTAKSDMEAAFIGAAAVSAVTGEASRHFQIKVKDGSIFSSYLSALERQDFATMTAMIRNMATALNEVSSARQRGALIHLWIKGQE